jgi:protein-tyrosine phosphatase
VSDRGAVVLEGAPNFRDLGGVRVGDGRCVRLGHVYRSGVLSDLTDGDLSALEQLGVATIVDLRSSEEIARRPNRVPRGAVVVEVPLTDISMSPSDIATRLAAGDTEGLGAAMLVSGNRRFARELQHAFAAVLRIVMDAAQRPAVLHCTAGKDRTGFAAALVLAALGVPRDAIVDDYLESNARLAHRHATILEDARGRVDDVEPLRALLQVRREYLEAGLDAIEHDHGSLDAYLRGPLGLADNELARFRREMLVDCPA